MKNDDIKQKLLEKAKLRGFYNFNIDHPKTWCEKMAWMQINDDIDLRAKCADKIRVHEYSIEKLGKDICVPIIKIYNNPNDIDFSELPDRFVLKCNHGWNMNIIINDKTKFKLNVCKHKLQEWLNVPFGKDSIEVHYLKIQRKCYAETFIENIGQSGVTDYKFLCFNGEPKYCQIFNERYKNGFHANYYDMDFNFVPISRVDIGNDPQKIDNKPKCFNLMKEYAKTLSNDFRFVRVDFYEVDGFVYLGELTFTPANGFVKWTDPKIDKMFGDMINIQ